MAKTKYYKVGPKASLFHDRINNITVNRFRPTKFSGNLRKSDILTKALTAGAIQEIGEAEYKELMSRYGNKNAEAKQIKLEEAEALKAEVAEQKKLMADLPVKDEDDEDEDTDDDDDDDDDEEEKTPKKRAPKKK